MPNPWPRASGAASRGESQAAARQRRIRQFQSLVGQYHWIRRDAPENNGPMVASMGTTTQVRDDATAHGERTPSVCSRQGSSSELVDVAAATPLSPPLSDDCPPVESARARPLERHTHQTLAEFVQGPLQMRFPAPRPDRPLAFSEFATALDSPSTASPSRHSRIPRPAEPAPRPPMMTFNGVVQSVAPPMRLPDWRVLSQLVTFQSPPYPQTQPTRPHASRRGAPHNAAYSRKAVCRLDCAFCNRLLCNRGMKAILLADKGVELYSTDAPPSAGELVGEDYKTRDCHCSIRDFACLGCGNVMGYHVTQPCAACLGSCNNGHFWMFHVSQVVSSDRRHLNGTQLEAMMWSEIPRADLDGEASRGSEDLTCR